jgi:hypothetical protein
METMAHGLRFWLHDRTANRIFIRPHDPTPLPAQ